MRLLVMGSPSPEGLVFLRKPLHTDFGVLAAIRRDPDMQSMLMTIPDATDDGAVQDWIDRRMRDPDGAFRVVADTASNKAVGFVQVSQVHRRNRHGYGGLALMRQARGHGHGHTTVALLMRLASHELALTKLLLEVREDNRVALKVYCAAGFRIVGKLADHFLDRDSKNWDVLLLEHRFSDTQP